MRGHALPALAVAAVTAVGLWSAAGCLQQDFAAYRAAGAARRAGLDPYVNQVTVDPRLWDGVALFRHSRFLYPPLVADLFRPLAALPFRTAKVAFTLATIAAWVGAACVAAPGPGRAVFLLASVAFFPLWQHLERGQIDLGLLLLLAVAWRARDRVWLAGLALAAAIAVKPALLGVALVVAALGRLRLVAASLAALAAIAGLTALVDGPARLREYVREVAPRAGLYGEGGTEAMLLPPDRLPAEADPNSVTVDGRAYALGLWDVPTVASLPRLLAPDEPARAAALLPFLVLFGLLAACARRTVAAGGDGHWLYWGAAIASVIASPAGWIMGLVFALPLAPRLASSVVRRGWPPALTIAGGLGWLGIAAPWPVPGVATGAAVVLVGVVALAGARGQPGPAA